jgi:hypothetical protein
MADRMMLIGWGTPVRGMENRALESFNEAMEMLGRMQQDGRIESFQVCLLEPNSDMDGFLMVMGTAEQISAMRADEEFQRNTIMGSLCVDGIRHIEGYTNEGVAQQMMMYNEAVSQVPQRA